MTSVPRNREQEEETNIKTGIVEFHDSKKGFGFIKDLSNNYKYFVDGVRVLYDGVYGFLGIPLTERASKELGRGTKWCTSGDKDKL